MKHCLQFSPAMSGAVVCAVLWFALWLIPVRPSRPQTARRVAVRPPAVFLPAGISSMRGLRSPSLFALPSEQGFSGIFPRARVDLLMPSAESDPSSPLSELNTDSLELPGNQRDYLARVPAEQEVPDQISLQEAMPQLKEDLPVPGAHPAAVIPQPERIALFFSPELQARIDAPPQLNLSGALPSSVRIYLGVRPDGTVDQVLFDAPVENTALAGAIRQWRFAPAPDRTDNWLDLRFTPGESL